MKLRNSRFHFVGIGGIGMSGLAELLHNMGATVTGSDLSENDQTRRLQSFNIKVYKEHSADNISEMDCLVYSSAIPRSNPELIKAREMKIPIIPRAEILSEVMRLKRSIAIAGTHGKTTTTSMAASLFIHGGFDPTVVVGGRLDLIKSTSKLGDGDWLVGEADESDGSFVNLTPEIAVITNIDNDHLDYYGTIENCRKAFLEFAHRVPFYGFCIVFGDDPEIKKLFKGFDKRVFYFGFNKDNDYYIQKENSFYYVFQQGQNVGEFKLKMPGDHNAINALAAFAAGHCAGISPHECIQGLEAFEGVDRRFQYLGEKNGIKFYDDYGHHPTEVQCVLKAFKEGFPNNRIVVAFQPHRYSRTQQCWAQFVSSFSNCDQLFVTKIYPASEKPIDGITAEKLAAEIDHNNCNYIETLDFKKMELEAGDILLTLGAGDIYHFGKNVLNAAQ